MNEVETVLSNGKNMDKNVLKELMTEIKKTGDEEITFEQFKEMMMNFADDDVKYYKQFSSNKKIDFKEIINKSININEYNYDENNNENDSENFDYEENENDENIILIQKTNSNEDLVNQ